ncbi:hypothetical protein FE257_007395 [Aspergillus nanangensis]|uniref:Galactose oxidase-like Early set domain-containing protein n=1 Tax=Aspergillus nanangensis TaxID=2582783 RepID=A0AAD4GU23_ASPNN|nr:hypothetical protein FE257_007395 [Aspergillus nanangensis]
MRLLDQVEEDLPSWAADTEGKLSEDSESTLTEAKFLTICMNAAEKVTTKRAMDQQASSIIRYGSTTHTVNTDQRRIAVQLQWPLWRLLENTYNFQIPNVQVTV